MSVNPFRDLGIYGKDVSTQTCHHELDVEASLCDSVVNSDDVGWCIWSPYTHNSPCLKSLYIRKTVNYDQTSSVTL